MSILRRELRGKLEKAVLAAREEATKGAESALIALGVGDVKKPGHLDADGEVLRRRLRARGRQAGDVRRADNSQETAHLVQECAYEHWHRMLFARFLAENELLRHTEMGVAVSLEECEELAREEGLDLWELAARFAQHMLPQVFRQDDPVLHLRLPTEARNKLTAILNELPSEVFTADDSLGWTYQFWQTKRKKEVNKSGVKIGADELSPVTQLFTEDYMVEFLLHNTLGAWWAGKLGPIQAASEEEARDKAALPQRDGIGVTWTYLRFIQDEQTKTWKPAAGTFDGWPKKAKEITFLDPCMGSGHFPVFALPILARLRMEEGNLSARDAIHAVLRDNIHGLELDPRCCQIGAFNLALTAWKLAGYQPLPPLHVACCGLAPQAKLADWIALAGENDKLKRGMERLYKLFEQASVLGSLINPRLGGGDLLEAEFHELQPLLEKAMAQEAKDDASREMAVTARGLAKAAEILARQFTLVATNVPYLGSNDFSEDLAAYTEREFPEARTDLATCFLQRCIEFCSSRGTSAIVSPQSWLFLGPYRRLRRKLLSEHSFGFVSQLGKRAFETISGEVVNVNLSSISKAAAVSTHKVALLDVTDSQGPASKASSLASSAIEIHLQKDLLLNPDHRISTAMSGESELLRDYADSYKGIATGDLERFIRSFWENPLFSCGWSPMQVRPEGDNSYGGKGKSLLWENGSGQLHKFVADRLGENGVGAWLRGKEAWGRQGIAIGQMTSLPSALYFGDLFDENTAAVIPKDSACLPAIWEFCRSREYRDAIHEVDKSSLKIPNLTLLKVPFDLAYWQKVADEKYPDGLPKPHSDDPTQWLFNGHPKGSEQPLHVAVARLLGYRWPRQTGSSFPDCSALGPDGLEKFADEDGIVCQTSLRGEANATDRLRELLGAALGSFDERQLVAAAGKKGSKSKSLEDWLRDEFFEQHCELFDKRPFVWHIWDGREDGFHALVNCHKLAGANGAGRRTLESLTYGYLGDWITRQKHAKNSGEEGADDRYAAALELREELKKILAGEPPYDLFIRWKPLHQQPIGWEPDINDGIRLNARPFLTATLSRGKKGAGLFRTKPNIHWNKDKGNEPLRAKEDFPWFWNGEEFTRDRVNDVHLKPSDKEAARKRHQPSA